MTGHQVCDKTSMVLKRIQEAKQQAQAQFEREAAMLKDLTDTLDSIKTAVTNKGGLTSRLHRELDELKSQKQALDKVGAARAPLGLPAHATEQWASCAAGATR